MPSGTELLRIRVGDHPQGSPIAVPLFGAPAISDETRTLVAAAALAGPVTLIVDDLTPRFCYRTYSADQARGHYRRLSHQHHGEAVFLTDPPDLADRINQALDTLTFADLRKATGPRAARRRGALTGFDAIHLAVMGVACTTATAAATAKECGTLAVKSANAAHAHVLTQLGAPTCHNAKTDVLVEGPVLALSPVHAKQRRDGYRRSGADDG